MIDNGTVDINLGSILQGLTLAILVWFWNAFHQIKDQLTDLSSTTKEWQAKIDVALFGAKGDNGIHGTVKDHEQRLRHVETIRPE